MVSSGSFSLLSNSSRVSDSLKRSITAYKFRLSPGRPRYSSGQSPALSKLLPTKRSIRIGVKMSFFMTVCIKGEYSVVYSFKSCAMIEVNQGTVGLAIQVLSGCRRMIFDDPGGGGIH